MVSHAQPPTPQQVRRALARAERGAALDLDEATVLLAATGDGPRPALRGGRAGARRRAGRRPGDPGVVTYSPKVFIPVTKLCRDRCHYCTFVESPGQLQRAGHGMFLSPDEILDIARQGAELGCLEALFTLGDRPEDRWPEAREWLDEQGYDSTLAYVRAMAVRVLEETGLLPHLNPGVMSWEELNRLKPVSPSMGMMLETTSRRLFETKGEAHFGSPDKDPAVRLRVLEDAGRLSIPFTTGLLVGIGETLTERAETILALRATSRAYGAVQEVIVQNFRAKPDTAMRHADDLGLDEYRATIAVTRLAARAQGPRAGAAEPGRPRAECRALLDAGVDDWGGVSPLTPDHVNPERPWPSLERLRAITAECGFELAARLTVHPEYVRPRRAVARPPDLCARRGAGPRGRARQARRPAHRAAVAGAGRRLRLASGRTDLFEAVDTEGRTDDRRSDFSDVYGDWDSVSRPRARPVVSDGLGRPAPPRDDAALRGRREGPGQPLRRARADADDRRGRRCCEQVCRLADDLRRETVGDEVTYVVNRNINFTNVCYVGCRFCAFAQRRTDADAYSLSLDEVADRAQEAWELGATEVCMQGGIDPELPATAYFDLVTAVKQRVPEMHVHAFSPMEVVNGTARTGLSIEDFLIKAREAGLGSLPGTAAEILDDEVRWVLTKGKLPTRTWIEVVTTAHRVGIPTTSTMMYGHVDNPRHWVNHLRVLSRIQDETGRLHRVRAAAVRAHQRPDLPRRRRPSRPDPARQPRRPRDGPDPAARPDPQHPDQLGQARRRRHPRDARRPAPTTSAAP